MTTLTSNNKKLNYFHLIWRIILLGIAVHLKSAQQKSLNLHNENPYICTIQKIHISLL